MHANLAARETTRILAFEKLWHVTLLRGKLAAARLTLLIQPASRQS